MRIGGAEVWGWGAAVAPGSMVRVCHKGLRRYVPLKFSPLIKVAAVLEALARLLRPGQEESSALNVPQARRRPLSVYMDTI